MAVSSEKDEDVTIKGIPDVEQHDSPQSADSDKNASYRKRIGGQLGGRPEYNWLRRFLSTPGPSVSQTRINILDCVGDQIQYRGSFFGVDDEFSSQLASRPDNVDVRLILTTYRTSWLVDRAVVDRLSSAFDVHPDFLRRHFFYYFIYVEDGIPDDDFRFEEDDIHSVPHALLSDENQDEFHLAATRSYHKLSAYYHRESKTVLLWVRNATDASLQPDSEAEPCPSQPAVPSGSTTLMRRYPSVIRHMSAHEIRVGSAEWAYFLHPYARDLILNFLATSYGDKRDLNTENFIPAADNGSIDVASGHLYQLMYESGSLKKLQHELKRIHSQCTTAEARRKFALLQDDAEYVNQNFERSAEYFREAKSSLLTTAQVEEAHASTDAALSVNRLSRLAFFFIPLSFTTSLFGMNVTEFGQGTIPLRTFFITALIVGICSVIPLWYSIMMSIKRSGTVDNARIIFRLMWCSPTLAFWYLALCAQFEHSVVMALCGRKIAAMLNLRPMFGYRFMEHEEAVQRMHRSYYSFGSENGWVERARQVVDTLEGLKEQSQVRI